MYATITAPTDRRTELLGIFARLEVLSASEREINIERGRLFARVDQLDGWVLAGSASAGEFGERHAIPANVARDLLDFGRAMRTAPFVEEQVRTGQITVPSAGLLGKVLADPSLQRDGDDWVGLARTVSTKSLRRLVQKRIEETRLGEGLAVTVTVFVAEQTRDDFRRAQVIASRQAGEFQTQSQTFRTLVDGFLDEHDEQRVTPGKRRLPHTALVNGRDVPVSVKREVYARQGERCAVPFCEFDIYLNLAHLVPHEGGGHREADNLVLLCWRHHDYLDHGLLRLAGTAAKPTFFDSRGRDLTHRFKYVHSQDAIDPEGTLAGTSNGSVDTPECRRPERPEESNGRAEARADPPAAGADPP